MGEPGTPDYTVRHDFVIRVSRGGAPSHPLAGVICELVLDRLTTPAENSTTLSALKSRYGGAYTLSGGLLQRRQRFAVTQRV